MRIIHGKGYSNDDRRGYRSLVHSNVVMAIQGLLSGAKQLDLQLSSEANQVGGRLGAHAIHTATRSGPPVVHECLFGSPWRVERSWVLWACFGDGRGGWVLPGRGRRRQWRCGGCTSHSMKHECVFECHVPHVCVCACQQVHS